LALFSLAARRAVRSYDRTKMRASDQQSAWGSGKRSRVVVKSHPRGGQQGSHRPAPCTHIYKMGIVACGRLERTPLCSLPCSAFGALIIAPNDGIAVIDAPKTSDLTRWLPETPLLGPSRAGTASSFLVRPWPQPKHSGNSTNKLSASTDLVVHSRTPNPCPVSHLLFYSIMTM
jgi:hypothetical protein